MTEEEWHTVIDTNLMGPFLCCRAVAPHMIGQKKGKIINISSAAADEADHGMSVYNVSKAGLNMLTRCLAVEWAPFNINVNGVGPGYLATDMNASLRTNPELFQRLLSTIPARRMGETSEVALLVVYLASSASDYLTGQTIYLDGGRVGGQVATEGESSTEVKAQPF